MAYYNLTNISEANTYVEIVEATNQITGGLYFAVILFAVFLIVFMIFKKQDTLVVFIGDSFLVSVMAALFFFAGFIPWYMLMIPVIMFIASIAIYIMVNS